MNNKDLHALWEERIEDQKASGKSIRYWCQENSLRESRFYYWRKKLQPSNTGNKQQVQWLPLKPTNQSKPNATIIVHIDRAKIEIPQGFDKYQLLEIIKVLKST